MARKNENRKYFIRLSCGITFEISELDYYNLQGRFQNGATKGNYKQRGESKGEVFDWYVRFEHIAMLYADGHEFRDYDINVDEKKDIEKRRPKPVGKPEGNPEVSCHDWNNPTTWEYVTNNVGGVQRYFKQCNTCGANSVLIKKAEVEKNLAAAGKTLDDLPFVE